jgi:ABC-type molybdate transport system substrate-binding protein
MFKKISLILSVAILAVLFTAMSGFAQGVPANCTYSVSKGTPASTIKIAVAANFFEPAKDMVGTAISSTGFLSTTNNVTVYICPDSTGVLETAIANNPGLYDSFFAADNSVTNWAASIGITNPVFTYAKGMPVLFGYRNTTPYKTWYVSDVTSLVSKIGGSAPAPSGNVATLPDENTPSDTLANYAIADSTANDVAIADIVNAPYGTQANAILNNMTPAGQPDVDRAYFSTVGTAYNAVGTTALDVNGVSHDVKSGFVSRAQVCDYIKAGGTGIAYVEFPDYLLNQEAVQLTPAGLGLYNYIQDEIDDENWNDFLTDHCYETL